jgi:hypothetical protein
MTVFFDRVRFFTPTVGAGASVAVGAAYAPTFMTPAEAGVLNADLSDYAIIDGLNMEVGQAVFGAGATSFTRTVTISKIGGVVGVTPITLTGAAEVFLVDSARQLELFRTNDATAAAHIANVSNPHSTTKAQVGLGNVDNTSDVNKPVSTAQAAAIALKIAGPGTVTSGNPVVFSGTTGLAVAQVTFGAFKTSLALVKGDVGLGNVDNTSDVNKPVSTAQAAADALRVLKAGDTMSGFLVLHADPSTAMQAATKQYVDQLLAAQDAMIFKGVIDCSANPNYPAADRGWTYRVSVAGKIGGASGINVEAGDLLLCLTDGTASGNQATVGANWTIAQTNLDGAVIGPASAVSGNYAVFSGTSGKLIADGGSPALKADLAGPTFTGDPKAPTPSPGDNDTSIATTAFVTAAIAAKVPTTISDTAPGSPLPGHLWWESDTGRLFIRYDDGTSVQWVDVAASGTIPPASTTDVLTGTDVTRFVTPDALAALWEQGANIASAATITLGEGGLFYVTGAASISDIDFGVTKSGRAVWLIFEGGCTLVHNATTLNLPGGANILTQAGDLALFLSHGGDNVACYSYTRANGTVLPAALASTTEVLTGINTAKVVTPSALAAGLWARASNISPAATLTFGDGGQFYVVGGSNTTITAVAFSVATAGREVRALFYDNNHTLVHSSTFQLPGGKNIVTQAGDVAVFTFEGASTYRCIDYERASGRAVTEATTGFKNILTNGGGQVWQRSALGVVTDDQYVNDRWVLLMEAGNCAAGIADWYSDIMIYIYQNHGSAQRLALLQIVENKDAKKYRSQQVTLSGKALQGVTGNIKYAILEWNGTADVVTSDLVNNWASTNYTNGNFFITDANLVIRAVGTLAATNATLHDLAPLTATLGSSYNNLMVMVWTETQLPSTQPLMLVAQLEAGPHATVLEKLPYGVELDRCQRYTQVIDVSGAQHIASGMCYNTSLAICLKTLSPPMRLEPSLAVSAVASFEITHSSAVIQTTAIVNGGSLPGVFAFQCSVASGLTAGGGANLRGKATGSLILSAEL